MYFAAKKPAGLLTIKYCLMYAHIRPDEKPLCPLSIAGKTVYAINENYLLAKGFEKNELLSGPLESVYRYYRPSKNCSGIELIFEKEFGILSVEEFWLNKNNNLEYFTYTIVGKFRISSDEDLAFIFSKNIRLNYIFNMNRRRV
jgi:hypothetical protein